ncbi:TPA: hypothetical protein DIU22_03975 [Candidatus Woesebacteria bacterium]|nr:hypothetical protein [Candidatus Woesebacteria bacterium]
MDKLEQFVAQLKENVVAIESEIATSKEKGFVYARSKNIRKAAQNIKVIAQDLRTATSETFKAPKL